MATQTPVSIEAAPAAGQLVEHDGKLFNTVREGSAYILIPPNTRTSVDPQAKAKADDGSLVQNVFYNPIQQFNRDLSVLAIKAFGEDLCEKRRLKHERDSVKQHAKKDRKRKRKAGLTGDEDEHDEGVKLRKTEDGAAVVVEDGPAQAEAVQGASSAEVTLDADANIDGGVAIPENGTGPAPYAEGTAVNPAAENDDPPPPQHEGEGGDLKGNGEQSQQPWRPKFRILDALSATGLRALRYASEMPFATSITANDMDRNATKSIQVNVEHNKLSSIITASTANAIAHMYGVAFPPEKSHGPSHVNTRYDVIDLDPYGTAAPFIDAALQALNDGGMLCVTCTDSGVFASCGYSEKTYSLYGGMPIKGNHSHEGGLRIILHSIASAAAKYGLAIEPLLSLSIDYYVRMFVRVTKSPADVKFLAGKTMLVYGCDAGCGAWTPQLLGRNVRQTGKNSNPQFNFKHAIAQAPSTDRHCEHCGSVMHVAGPMWAGPMHNAAFVENLLVEVKHADKDVYQTKPRLEGMLDTALDELCVIDHADEIWRASKEENGTPGLLPKTSPEVLDPHPFFFIPSALAKVIHCQAPPEAAIKGALRHAGYRATRSHCKPGSVKTDAPWAAIWEIMREWVRQRSPIKEGALKEGVPGWKIMQAARKPEELEVDKAQPDNASKADTPEIVTETNGNSKPAKERPVDPKRVRVVFDEVLGKDKSGKRLVRYQQNPRENWGPMARAKGSG